MIDGRTKSALIVDHPWFHPQGLDIFLHLVISVFESWRRVHMELELWSRRKEGITVDTIPTVNPIDSRH